MAVARCLSIEQHYVLVNFRIKDETFVKGVSNYLKPWIHERTGIRCNNSFMKFYFIRHAFEIECDSP